jgi:hypothetical protein
MAGAGGLPIVTGTRRTPGKDIDPYEGKEWRTGADGQTTLFTDRPLKVATLSLPAGRYGLHTIPVQGPVADTIGGSAIHRPGAARSACGLPAIRRQRPPTALPHLGMLIRCSANCSGTGV